MLAGRVICSAYVIFLSMLAGRVICSACVIFFFLHSETDNGFFQRCLKFIHTAGFEIVV